ncbi:hypothetical protein K7X08_037412 [Anisodus acutangulus]|uniref:Calmodulin-binding domain-containing protein n=1 Tax=Anisodus acutangulus TaxID=402998 RepID=A0A9Q1N001_9SOLA|nr:hypothetical protein K7X08_037412 [Anisodus acutangulus]
MDSSTKIHQGIGKAEKIQPKEARYLELEPDPEAEKVNLKHQIEDERKRTEEWMLDYALQQAISQLAPTQKRKVGLLVTAFETVVPPKEVICSRLTTLPQLREDEIINRELSKNEPFAIKQSSGSDDFIEAKCSTKFSSASACNGAMELEENLQEKDDKATSNEDLDRPSCSIGDSESWNYTPTENAEPNASAKNLHVARLPKGKHRSMWTLIHRHVISDEYTESDSKVTCGADEENHKFCAAESSCSLLKFSERESMTTNQDADNQGVEARKFLAIKLVREAIERILLPEVQDQSSDNQSVASEEKISRSLTPRMSQMKEVLPEKTLAALRNRKLKDKSRTKHPNTGAILKMDSSTKIHQGIGKAEKIQPKEARYLELEPDPEAEKVNLKHQIEDERKRTEEWMLDYALQQAISQLAPTQKRKVGLLVTAFETVVPPQRSNMQVKFPKMKTRNEDNLQMEDDVLEKYSTHVDKRNAEDDWSMLKK